MKQLKVSKDTNPQQLAGAINSFLEKQKECELTAIGPKSIVIAVKSLALLTRIFKRNYSSNVNYIHIKKDDEIISGISFKVKRIN